MIMPAVTLGAAIVAATASVASLLVTIKVINVAMEKSEQLQADVDAAFKKADDARNIINETFTKLKNL